MPFSAKYESSDMGAILDDSEITLALFGVREGDQAAAGRLWDAYFHRLVNLARNKLGTTPRRMADEEDIALSAMDSFIRRAEDGGFPHLRDRDDLWKLLVTITVRKVHSQRRHQLAKKQGAGGLRGESVFAGTDSPGLAGAIESAEPTPEMIAQVSETCDRLLEGLADDSLRNVAQLKIAGFTNEEIASKLGCVTRSVERKLERIRESWSAVLREATDE